MWVSPGRCKGRRQTRGAEAHVLPGTELWPLLKLTPWPDAKSSELCPCPRPPKKPRATGLIFQRVLSRREEQDEDKQKGAGSPMDRGLGCALQTGNSSKLSSRGSGLHVGHLLCTGNGQLETSCLEASALLGSHVHSEAGQQGTTEQACHATQTKAPSVSALNHAPGTARASWCCQECVSDLPRSKLTVLRFRTHPGCGWVPLHDL